MPSIQHEPPAAEVRSALLTELPPATLYAILRLRVEVFVVEQECAYAELDGRDAEPDARQLWIEAPDATVLATLRLLSDPDGRARIGRVATAPAARGRGLAAVLMRAALDAAAERTTVLDAQAHLESWYAGFGFARDGAEYVEDGIPHVPMRRAPGPRR